MMGPYRKVSTLVIVIFVLYMCLVSMFHFGLQARDWQNRRRNGLQLITSEGHDLQHKELQKWTRGQQQTSVNQIVTHKNSLSGNISDTLQRKSSSQDMSASEIGTNTSPENSPDSQQPLIMRKLKEKHSQHTTDLNQEYTAQQSNDSSIEAQVSQIKVDFISLRGGYYIYGIFLDKRYPKGEHIRILTMQPTLNMTTQLICQFDNMMKNRGINVKAEPYEMCENHGKKYGGWIYSCTVPQTGGTILQTVSLLVVTEKSMALDRLRPVALQSLNVLEKNAQSSIHSLNSDENIKQISITNDNTKQTSINNDNTKQTSITNDNTKQTSIKNNNIKQASITNHQQTYIGDQNMKLAVCVPPLHGDICLSKIINFIEMCQLLGADKVFLYIHDIPMDILAFLQNYTGHKPNILSLVIWDLPSVNNRTMITETNQIIWNHGQLLAVQHCLYTNMPHFDWLLFMDIDEMLIPRTTNTWPELLSEVVGEFIPQFQRSSIAGISFQSAFFQHDFQTQATNSIDYFQYLHRTRETSSRRSKLFVQPFQVFELGIHHLSRALSKDMNVINVGANQALLHHYRKCVPDYDTNSNLHCEVLVKDETILRYEVPMTVASREVIATAMEFFAQYS